MRARQDFRERGDGGRERGPGHDENPGEEIGKRLGWLVPGKYRPVQARDVARVLVQAAKDDVPGMHIFESDQIPDFATVGVRRAKAE